jgi:PAS domain S-box-containing protein
LNGISGSLDTLAGVPLHLALEHTGVGVVACDAEGNLTLLSPAVQKMFGLDYAPLPEEVLPDVFRLYHADGTTIMAPDEMPIARARGGQFINDEVVAAHDQDGATIYLRCNGAPLLNDAGEPDGALVLVQDITAEHEATLRSERLRARLVETINHEFRTPLAALLAHVELIHDHRDRLDDLDPDLPASLDAIERSGWRLRDLVQEVADLVACEGDEAPADRRPRRMRAV